jgi:hypothetical protein
VLQYPCRALNAARSRPGALLLTRAAFEPSCVDSHRTQLLGRRLLVRFASNLRETAVDATAAAAFAATALAAATLAAAAQVASQL